MHLCHFITGELWSMLIEAQSSEDGIPTSLVEKKMKEIQDKVFTLLLNCIYLDIISVFAFNSIF